MKTHKIWAYIPGTEYLVSIDGDVPSLRTNTTLKHSKNAKSYHQVGIYVEGKKAQPYVSRLVAQAFIPLEDEQAHHRDYDKDNQENSNDGYISGERNHLLVKVTYKGVTYPSVLTAANAVGRAPSNVSRSCKNKTGGWVYA